MYTQCDTASIIRIGMENQVNWLKIDLVMAEKRPVQNKIGCNVQKIKEIKKIA